MKSLARRLNYYWRLLATGVSFACFGGGGLFLSWILFPLLALLPGNDNKRIIRVRRTIHYSCKFFVMLLRFLGVLKVHTKGAEKLNAGAAVLIVANHPTLVDVVVLLSLLERADYVVKRSMWDNFFLRGAVREAHYICDKNIQEFIENCTRRLLEGNSLVVFPEGTRSPPGRMGKFKRGAAEIALRSRAPVLPVIITCVPPTLSKESKWYQIPSSAPILSLVVGEAIQPAAVVKDSCESWVFRRKFTTFLQDLFEREVANG